MTVPIRRVDPQVIGFKVILKIVKVLLHNVFV